jgi:hypothetical protein
MQFHKMQTLKMILYRTQAAHKFVTIQYELSNKEWNYPNLT